MKNIKIKNETWEELMLLKLKCKKRSIDETIKMLIERAKDV